MCSSEVTKKMFLEKERPPKWQKRAMENSGWGNHAQRADTGPNQRALPAPRMCGFGTICRAGVWNFYGQLTGMCIPLSLLLKGNVYDAFSHPCYTTVLQILLKFQLAYEPQGTASGHNVDLLILNFESAPFGETFFGGLPRNEYILYVNNYDQQRSCERLNHSFSILNSPAVTIYNHSPIMMEGEN